MKSRIKGGSASIPSTTMNSADEETKAGTIPVLVNSTEFPKMPEAKRKVRYGEPIGHNAPSKAKRNVSVGKGKKTAKAVINPEENWDEDSLLNDEVMEVEAPMATKDDKKRKQKKKKRKLGVAVVDTDDLPLSNEATHFRTFARRHFSIILRRMGKMLKYIKPNLSSSQVENFFILLLTFIISSEEFYMRKITSRQSYRDRIRNSEVSAAESFESRS